MKSRMTSSSYSEFVKQIDQIATDYDLEDFHAFVYWYIESSFDMDSQAILDAICDGTHDKGIDGVLIDDIERKVTVIQSKYEREGDKVQIKENEIKLLASVKSYFRSRKSMNIIIANANPAAKRLLNNAFEAHGRGYDLNFVFITTHKLNPRVPDLVYNTLGFKPLDFRIEHYGEIMQLYKDRLRDFTPRLGNYNLPYKSADLSMLRKGKYKSWILSIPLEEIRNLVNRHGDKLFRKNVRNFLGANRTNKGMRNTLDNHQENFWYFNNGLCILCDEGSLVQEQGYVRMVNPQIINGCQTATSIQRYNGDLSGDVLVRIIESRDHEFVNEITLYQNTSNPVRKRDLKSNDQIQTRLKSEFRRLRWYYETKRGEEFDKMAKKNRSLRSIFKFRSLPGYKVLENEKAAKALAAISLTPGEAVSRGTERFFDELYEDVFPKDISTSEVLATTLLHRAIRDTYGSSRFHEFKNEFAFKNPASYFVLRFIADSIGPASKWQKHMIEFYENASKKEYKRFFRQFARIVDQIFKVVYDSWKDSGEPDHNTYLGGQKTFREMKASNRRKLKWLGKQASKTVHAALKPGS